MNFPPDTEFILKMVIIYSVLIGISIWFNRKVGKLEEEGQLDGIKALLVVVGVTYTLIMSAPLIGLWNTFVIGGSFFFSLAPMVRGEVARYLKSRKKVMEDVVSLLKSLKPGNGKKETEED